MATYKELKEYVKNKYGLNIKSCHIAHVKEMCGLELIKVKNRTEYNYRKNPCPKHKIEPIKDALKHFNMI